MLCKLNDHYFPLIEFLTMVKFRVFASGQADDSNSVFRGPYHNKITTDHIHLLRTTWSQGPTPFLLSGPLKSCFEYTLTPQGLQPESIPGQSRPKAST